MQRSEVHVYWEKQMELLCGVHCLNSLLQGPFLDEVQLANIALELDQKEQELMGGRRSKKSHNVADDGNYSIQVLREALTRMGGLSCDSLDSETNKQAGADLCNETGFICNSAVHWFAIRRINRKWYNLNSTNKRGPEIISDFYLSAFLMSVRDGGYTIFVVRGTYPQSTKALFPHLNKNQYFFTEADCDKLHQENLKNKKFQLNIAGYQEESEQGEPISEESKKEDCITVHIDLMVILL